MTAHAPVRIEWTQVRPTFWLIVNGERVGELGFIDADSPEGDAMTDHTGIPEIVVHELAQSYTPKGVEQAWTARWRTLDGRRLCDVWETDRRAALDAIESMNRGDYV